MEKVPMTASGYKALEVEIKHLKTVERPRIIKAIADAREHGDLSENAEYHAAKEQQGLTEARVADLEDKDIVAVAAHDVVGAGASQDQVIARPSVNRVIASAGADDIIAATAIDPVIADACVDGIVATVS